VEHGRACKNQFSASSFLFWQNLKIFLHKNIIMKKSMFVSSSRAIMTNQATREKLAIQIAGL